MPTKKVAAPVQKKAAAPKKVAKPVAAQKPLVYASNDESFWTTDGQILNSMTALRDAFAQMQKAVFTHHVTKDKNDFAAWVDDVLGDSACAAELRKAKTPATARMVVVKHLKTYRI